MSVKPLLSVPVTPTAPCFHVRWPFAALLSVVVSAAGAQSSQVQAVFQHGATAMRQGQSAAAEQAFRQAVQLAPDLPEAHLDLGLVLGREGKLDQAIVSLRRAIGLNPHQPSAHMFLGIFLFQTNQPEAARQELEIETAADPANTEALTWLGNVELASNHPERAVLALDRAAALAPDDLNLLELRGRAHNRVAHDSYAHMARLAPNDWHVHRVQAQIFADENRHADAAKEYEAAVKLAPHNPDLFEGLGDEYRAISQLDAAEVAYRQELTLAPTNPVAMYNLGSVEIERGDSAAGVPLLLTMVKAYPGSPVAAYYLGRGLAAIGQDQDAIHWLQQSAADQNGEIAKRSSYELTRLFRKLHRPAEAQAALQRYNTIRQQQEKASNAEVQDWKKLAQPSDTMTNTSASPVDTKTPARAVVEKP